MVEAIKIGNSTSIVDDDESDLDEILVRIGEFGKYQMKHYLLISIPMLYTCVFPLSFVFSASSVVHRCQVPECDNPLSSYQEPWTEFSIPFGSNGELDNCRRYIPYNKTLQREICFADNYNRSMTEGCGTDLIFRDKEVTISNDFGIYCDNDWMLSMVGLINNFGQLLGVPLGGYFADRYGRRNMLVIGGFMSAIMGIIRSFSVNYKMFIIFEFLDNLWGGGVYSVVFTLALELVGPKARVLACTLISCSYAFGGVFLSMTAKNFPNWRVFLRILYIPALMNISLLWTLPESVRWLLHKGKEEKAAKILRKAAKVNKRRLSENSIDKLFAANRAKMSKANEGKFPIREAFRLFFWRIMNLSLSYFAIALVYIGLILNSVLIGGNKYDNFMYISLIEIPGVVLPYLTMDRFGRRISLFGYMIACGLCTMATVFVPPDSYALQLTLYLIGKMAITAAFQVLLFYTSEVFPTSVRTSLLSFCAMIGQLGSMLAPMTPIISKYYEQAPSILFTGFSIISGCLVLFLPETSNINLPTTIKEAENIGQKKASPELKTANFNLHVISPEAAKLMDLEKPNT